MVRNYLIAIILLLVQSNLNANISLPNIFGDHMVLQQNESVLIWGWGKPGETVSIHGSWDKEQVYKTKVTSNSSWEISIQTPSGGGPYYLEIKGYNTIIINDILIGEVWLGSGQSNIEWATHMGIENGEIEKSKANYPEIRFFNVLSSTAEYPQNNLFGEWVVCTPESMYYFSAVLYFFGREIHANLNVPVGLIHSSWGGTPIEIWMPKSVVENDRAIRKNAALLKPVEWGPTQPGKAYNAMIAPLIPFKIAGALWYQGESNVGNASQYARTLSALIESWRDGWNDEFPFYYVQIAPYSDYGSDHVNGAILRDQQRQVMQLTNKTGMVVISDIGNLSDIHPRNKLDVGKRLASWALHQEYNKIQNGFSGPIFESIERTKGKIILHFNYNEGLHFSNDETLFEVTEDGTNWELARAKIEKGKVILSPSNVNNISSVRYDFKNDSVSNLLNKNELPASCFQVHLQKD